MAAYLTLPGSTALSEFRLQQLFERLKSLDDRVTSVAADHFYLVWSAAPLSPDQVARLQALLDDGAPAHEPAAAALWVVPRIGTISPWASKATDIAHSCGMADVRRIERGVRYRIGVRKGLLGGTRTLDADTLTRLAAPLHDRMTESVLLQAPQPEDVFRSLPGKPMQRIAVTARGRAALDEANTALGLALSTDEIDYLLEAFQE
ncbi:MAG TPA: phosphoribosylformylglycinamidine synthase, partial [Quisquiliibacterium sp.]|nr:phosphoribosylformylglycinamidine synthase [Quisquiliibacterium sp.]